MNLRIRTERIKNKRPETAATIISLPPVNFCWSPEEVKTLIEPMTIKIKAMPPASPVAIWRIFDTKSVGLVGILPRAVGHFSLPSTGSILQGFSPGANVKILDGKS